MKTIVLLMGIFVVTYASAQNLQRTENKERPASFKTQTIVSPLPDPISFFQENMIGPCVSVSNVQISYTGDKNSFKSFSQIGLWDDPNNTLGISYGIILSTGDVFNVIDSAGYFASTDVNGPGDSLLTNLAQSPTYDAVSIEFDFIPLVDSIVPFEFIFASEEYPEWVGSPYNDIFGFFIQGPGFNSLTNIALVPGTTMPIAINNVNQGLNSTYYIDNTNGTFWAYDGYTVKFTLHVPVIANEQYHFKFALADAGDAIFDSGVILAAGTFMGVIDSIVPSFTYSILGNTVYFQNTTPGNMSYLWDFGDGTTSTDENPVHTYSTPGVYDVKLKIFNQCYENEVTFTVDLLQQHITPENTDKISINELSNGIYQITGNLQQPIHIYSISGQVVQANIAQNGNRSTIDLTSLPKGIYILKSDSFVYKLKH